MNKREGRTGDIIGRSGLEAFGDPFHESGLAGAQIAAQKDEQRRSQFCGEPSPKSIVSSAE